MKIKTILAILAATVCLNWIAFAQTWTPVGPPNVGWTAVACSAGGNKLFAIDVPSYPSIYGLSTNSGATWTTITEPQSFTGSLYGSWACIASSADGNTLLAMNYNTVWASTNSGVSWCSNTVSDVGWWTAVALSADGVKAVAVNAGPAYGQGVPGGIYTSTNSGMTWSETLAPSNTWSCVASSADGTILAAAILGSSLPRVPVYVSTNSGATWAPTACPPNMQCTAIASSADGRELIVGGFDGETTGAGMLYTSTNSGNTWISNSVPLFERWYGVASSADGTRLVAVSQYYGGIFTSTNSGMTWISNSLPNNLNWLSVASSADGTKLAAACPGSPSGGGIYTLESTPTPQLNSTLINGNLALSWLIPSTNFVVQQNSDLTTANWSGVTNVPVLNLTNLQYQVALPATAGNAFFRLKTP
jgi:hypothetical protein